MSQGNIFRLIPEAIENEIFEDIIKTKNIRIERILSEGQVSPESGWYDQDEHEWVIVLQGRSQLTFDDGTVVDLKAGDYIHIEAHTKHKVSWTDPSQVTVWLAIFYK
ncbi:cupin domain-containing protein [Limibacter armeniacum]|uniref:cupin domain-containing protein n=1 Tax=Limibacter armeniacum TaxID=466084 RepID=UPI002FE563B4